MSSRVSPLLIAAILVGALFGLHHIFDPDLFQHIAVGRAILDDPSSIGVAKYHHTVPDSAYVADKWLSSVVAAVIDGLGGEHALMLYQILLPALFAACCYLMLRSRAVDPSTSVMAVALILAACAFRLEPRPDTISLALIAFLLSLLRPEIEFHRALWAVPLLFVLWVNLHGYFFVGLLILSAAALVGWGANITLRRRLLILGLALLACLAHPQGWKALVWPLRQLWILREYPYIRQAILEFQPSLTLLAGAGWWRWLLLASVLPAAILMEIGLRRFGPRLRAACGLAFALPWLLWPPAGLTAWPYRLTIALIAAALVEIPDRLRRRRWLAPLLLAGFTLLAIPLLRNLSLVPIAALLLLAPTWSRALRSPGLRSAAAAALLLFVAWARFADHLPPGSERSPGWTGWGIDRAIIPVGAADFVERESLPGPLLNHFDNGGYLLYRFYPKRRVFISGNTSMYPPEFFLDFHRRVIGRRADPQWIADRYGVRTAVISHAAPEGELLVGKLDRDPRWALAYLDRAAAVYVLGWTRAAIVDLEERPEKALPAWLFPARRLYPDLNFALYLRNVGRFEAALREADRLWRSGPDIRLSLFIAATAELNGDLPRAIPKLEWALERQDTYPQVRSWLARALYHRAIRALDRGRQAPARADLEKARYLAPREPGPIIALARLEVAEGHRTEAVKLLSEALLLDEAGEAERLAARDPLLSPLIPAVEDSQPK